MFFSVTKQNEINERRIKKLKKKCRKKKIKKEKKQLQLVKNENVLIVNGLVKDCCWFVSS